jgi:RHS repeat-associated protein
MSYYKARFYSPTLGRFMQTDPINYTDGTGQAVIDAASTLTDHAGGVVALLNLAWVTLREG